MRNRRAASRDRHAIPSTGSDTATIADAIPLGFPGGRGRTEEQLGQPCGLRWHGGRDDQRRPRAISNARVDVMDKRLAYAPVLLERRFRGPLPRAGRHHRYGDPDRGRRQ